MDNRDNKSDQYEVINGLIYITRLLFTNIRRIAIIVLGVMVLTTVIVLLISVIAFIIIQ